VIGVWLRLDAHLLNEARQLFRRAAPSLRLPRVLCCLLAGRCVAFEEGFEGDRLRSSGHGKSRFYGQSPWCWRQATRVATSDGVLPYCVLSTAVPCT